MAWRPASRSERSFGCPARSSRPCRHCSASLTDTKSPYSATRASTKSTGTNLSMTTFGRVDARGSKGTWMPDTPAGRHRRRPRVASTRRFRRTPAKRIGSSSAHTEWSSPPGLFIGAGCRPAPGQGRSGPRSLSQTLSMSSSTDKRTDIVQTVKRDHAQIARRHDFEPTMAHVPVCARQDAGRYRTPAAEGRPTHRGPRLRRLGQPRPDRPVRFPKVRQHQVSRSLLGHDMARFGGHNHPGQSQENVSFVVDEFVEKLVKTGVN